MAVNHINETDTLNQGREKINAVLDQSNASAEKVDEYKTELTRGIEDAKQLASTAGDEAKQIATTAGEEANRKADQAVANSSTAVQTANQAVGTANQNKQDFDALRNEFEDLVAESGDSNPEIVQARTDTQGIKQATLQARLTRDFSNRMTTADAIKMFSGAVNTPQMMNFSGKTAGNTSTNPHQAFSDYTATTLKKPSASWNEVSQDNYNKLAGRDDSGVSTGSTQSGVIPQQMFKMDVINAIKMLAPNIFTDKSLEESIQFVKDNFISFTLSIRGKASSPNNNNLKVATYLENTDSYTTQLQDAAKEYTDFTVEINDSNFIDAKGIINLLVYSDSANGVTASNIDIDFFAVQVLVSLNATEVLETGGFIKKETLQEHIDNAENPHKVTKAQVGLSEVQNFGVADDAEAIIGLSTTKFMTPKNVKDSISSRALLLNAEKEQEVTSPVKFSINPQIGEYLPSLRQENILQKVIDAKSDPGLISQGSFVFERYGDIVWYYGTAKMISKAGANGKIIWGLEEWAEPAIFPRFWMNGVDFAYVDINDNNAVKVGSGFDAGTWLTVTASWPAKNPFNISRS